MIPINRVMLRNGFGFDIELVTHLPLWTWFNDADPEVDDPDVGVFEGFVIQLPFIKILLGKLV